MKALSLTLLAAALLAGCSGEPVYTRQPVTVKAGELGHFWLPSPTEADVKVPAEASEKKVPGRVVVAYVIDSAGRVVDPHVVSAEPTGLYEEAALNLIRTQKFRPAPNNTNLIPVRVKTEVTFNMGR